MSELLEHMYFDIRRMKGGRLEKHLDICDENGERIGEVREEGISAGQNLIRLWMGRGGAATRLAVLDDTGGPAFWVSGQTQKPMLVWDRNGKPAGRIVARKKGLHPQWELCDSEGQLKGSVERPSFDGPFCLKGVDGREVGAFSVELTSGKEFLLHSTHHEVLQIDTEVSPELQLLMVAIVVSHADAMI